MTLIFPNIVWTSPLSTGWIVGSFTAIFSTVYVVIVMDVSLVTHMSSVQRLDPDPRHADLSHHTRYAVDYLHTHDVKHQHSYSMQKYKHVVRSLNNGTHADVVYRRI